MALSSLFLNSLPMDNSLAITHFGLLYDVKTGKLIEVPEATKIGQSQN
jgi:hypothetical protein